LRAWWPIVGASLERRGVRDVEALSAYEVDDLPDILFGEFALPGGHDLPTIGDSVRNDPVGKAWWPSYAGEVV
jgi:hypothetical protein